MYMKRPLCYVAVIFSFLVFLFISLFPIKPNFDVDEINGLNVSVTGHVAFKDNKNGNIRVYLEKGVVIENTSGKIEANGIICELSEEDYVFDDIKIGQKVKISGEYCAYETPENEGQFDMRRYYLIRGYEGKIRKGRIEAKSEEYFLIEEKLFQIKMIAEELFQNNMSEEDSGIMSALVLGDKTDLDEEVKDLYQNAGISHILSLSGLHIASVGLCILTIFKKSGMPVLLADMLASLLMTLYAVLTGMSTSTKRALIMFVLAVLADMIGKSYDIMSAAAFAYMCTLLSNPYYLNDTGFLLSFGAIIGISITNPAIITILSSGKKRVKEDGIKEKIKKLCKGMVDSFLLTFSVSLTTLPIVATSYYKISRYSFICNLIVIPLMGVLLVLGIASVIFGVTSLALVKWSFGLCGAIGSLLCKRILMIASVILKIYEHTATIFADLPHNILVIGKPKVYQIIIYYFCMGIILLLAEKKEKITHTQRIIDRKSLNNGINNMRNYSKNHYKITHLIKSLFLINKNQKDIRYLATYSIEFDIQKKRIIRSIKVIFVFLFVISLLNLTNKSVKDLEIRNLSIGQGDCSVIFGKNTPVIIVDGGSSSIKNSCKYRLMPVLLSNGIDRVDYVFLSHLDSDHISAVMELLDDTDSGIRIKNVVLSDLILQSGDEEETKKLNNLKTSVINSGSNLYVMKYGDDIVIGDIDVKCIWPKDERLDLNLNDNASLNEIANANSNSMVLLITNRHNGFTSLFTGDIDMEAEKLILQDGKCNYLKVAHHGSNGSSSDDFLKQIKPDISVISCGLNNSYKHPGEEALERLNKIKGNHIFRTDLQGEIITRIDRQGRVSVETFGHGD